MIKTKELFKFLTKNKINFFSGVPDSILKGTKNYFEKKSKNNHIIAANEGLAVSACIGYNLATKKLPCVYLQNSGLGNTINPIISIAHKKVYGIPLFMLIGWRGAPGTPDEPQHQAKGNITLKLLKLLDIKYCVINKTEDFIKAKKILDFAKKNNSIVACLIKKNTLFENKKDIKKIIVKKNGINREYFLKKLLEKIDKNTQIVSTTGFTSRELFQSRSKYNLKKGSDFYMVGGMGHSSMVALGLSMNKKNQILCLDGDGSLLMHMGSIANVGFYAKKNFKHLVFNNFCHESVGGQKTNTENLKFKDLALGAGYKNYYLLKAKKDLSRILKTFFYSKGPSMLEVITKNESMKNLNRPKNLYQIKKNFINN